MAVILSAEHIKKSYTLKKLITDATLYISEHDRIGVVGINGTGKSTLLKILCGMEEPDGGAIMRRSGLRVSYLPQMPDYSEARTPVMQVLESAPRDVGAPDEYEARSLLMQLGITDFDADVRTLSGGQKKRVALAGISVGLCAALAGCSVETPVAEWLERLTRPSEVRQANDPGEATVLMGEVDISGAYQP